MHLVTKVTKPVIVLSKKRGLPVISYVDDLLLFHHDPEDMTTLLREVCRLLSDLGFIV